MKINHAKKISLLLAGLVVSLSACMEDHRLELLGLTTLKYEYKPTFGFVFKIKINNIGDTPIVEHGIVYTAYYKGAGNHKINPTVDVDPKIVFTSPIKVGINEGVFKNGINNDFIFGRTYFYYRAYAILNNGIIAYSNHYQSFTIGLPPFQ